METTINQRIKMIVDESGKAVNSYAAMIGVSQPTLKACVDGNNAPRFDTLQKILIANPMISAEWLMRGKGSMLREEVPNNVHSLNSNFSIFTIREIGDKTTFERSVAINMNQVKAIEDHATTCRIIMADGKEYEILCGFSDFIKR